MIKEQGETGPILGGFGELVIRRLREWRLGELGDLGEWVEWGIGGLSSEYQIS
jgi:hypothetical protein